MMPWLPCMVIDNDPVEIGDNGIPICPSCSQLVQIIPGFATLRNGGGLVDGDGDPILFDPSTGGSSDLVENADDVLDDGVEDAASVPQNTRYIRLSNGTDKAATFYIMYATYKTDGTLSWVPSAPVEGEDPDESMLTPITVEAGEAYDLMDGDWPVNARLMRVWARNEDCEWVRYRGIDFDLVPEVDENGEHTYLAPVPDVLVYGIRSCND